MRCFGWAETKFFGKVRVGDSAELAKAAVGMEQALANFNGALAFYTGAEEDGEQLGV